MMPEAHRLGRQITVCLKACQVIRMLVEVINIAVKIRSLESIFQLAHTLQIFQVCEFSTSADFS